MKVKTIQFIIITLLINIVWFWLLFTPFHNNIEAFGKFTADTIYYINIADNIHSKNYHKSDVYGQAITPQNFYAYLFVFFYKIFNKTQYYYLQFGYLILLLIFNLFIFLFFYKILLPKEFFIFFLIYLFNYFIFKSYTITNLLSNVIFMGLTFFIIFIFYIAVNTAIPVLLYISIFLAGFSSTIRFEGCATVASMFFYLAIIQRQKIIKYIIVFSTILLPFLLLHLLILSRGYKEYGYTSNTLFENWNFLALGYAIYRLLFRVYYEIFFNDIFKDYHISIRIISYVVSFTISLSIIGGIYTVVKSYIEKKETVVKFSSLFFVILFLFFLFIFLIRNPIEKRPTIFILLSIYDGRYLAFVYPALCFFIVKNFLTHYSSTKKLIFHFLPALLLISSGSISLFLAVKEKIVYLKSKVSSEPIVDYGINDTHVLCVIDKETSTDFVTRHKIWKRNFISYILFRKVCKYEYNSESASTYDWVIDFTGKVNLTGFKEIYSSYGWQNNFRVLKNQSN